MTERVRKLREQSLAAVPAIAHERGLLMTESAMTGGTLPPPLRGILFALVSDVQQTQPPGASA